LKFLPPPETLHKVSGGLGTVGIGWFRGFVSLYRKIEKSGMKKVAFCRSVVRPLVVLLSGYKSVDWGRCGALPAKHTRSTSLSW
jgi:hypothetical protein